MFTGLIQCVGVVTRSEKRTLAVRARIPRPKVGASIAVNGTCLTVTKTSGGLHVFDVGPETLARTNLGSLQVGDKVNIESSLRVGDEIGGHFVSGHVDATAKILALRPWGDGFARLRVELPPALRSFVVPKGSVTVDGTSLTVVTTSAGWFEVMLVPHTLERTTLGLRRPGKRVNLEADLLARYVRGGKK